MTSVSDENGEFAFSDVPYGDYIVAEIAAPQGYVLSSEQFKISIRNDGEVIEITAKNAPKIGHIELQHDGGDMDQHVTSQPKTSDDYNLFIWLIVIIAALTAASMIKISYSRNKRKEE